MTYYELVAQGWAPTMRLRWIERDSVREMSAGNLRFDAKRVLQQQWKSQHWYETKWVDVPMEVER